MLETFDNDNECKLKYLTKHIFRLVIAQSLRKKGTTLSSFLQELDNEDTLQYLRAEHVISDEDIELLYPDSSRTVSLEHLAFALLYTLMRTFFCKFSDDDQLIYKGKKPDQNDLTMAADLTRLQNHILELDDTELTEEVFVEKCRDLDQICIRLGILDAYNETDDSLTFDDDMKNTILEEFNKWKETHQRFETGLDRDIIQAKCRRLRLYILLVDGGTRVFRKLFDEQISPRDLQTTLSRRDIQRKIESLGKIIGKAQKKLLYPTSGSPNSATFDITLLSCLLRNVCNFTPNDRRWIDKKPKGTTTIEDIVRIREARNEVISHAPRTGNLTKTDFERHWCEISMALLRLNKKCKDPLPNLQSYIDDLKGKRLDPEPENDYQSNIESWKRIDEKMDETMQFLRKSTLESAYVQSKDTVKNVIDDKYFEETEQFAAAYNKLKKKKIIVLNGAPGEGKTTVAKKLLLKVSNNQRYIQLHSHKEWRSVNTDSVDAILIDDMFGAGSFSKEEYRKWQKYFSGIASAVQNKPLYVIITSRQYILSEALGKTFNLFFPSIFSNENIFTLSSKELNETEKNGILKKHFSKASVENKLVISELTSKEELFNQIVKLEFDGPELGGLTIGFPECTRLFFSSATFYKKGIEFYKDPMTCVKSYISELLKNDATLIAFFVLWSQESKSLQSLDLEHPVDKTSETIIEPLRMLQFQPEKHIREIRHVLRQHRGGFINFESISETFTFSHRVVQDAVGLISYEINPTAVIAYSDLSFLEHYFRISTNGKNNMSLGDENAESEGSFPPRSVHHCMEQLKMNVIPSRYLQIGCRLGSMLIRPGSEAVAQLEHLSILRLNIFDDRSFCSTFLDILHKRGCLEKFLSTKARSLDAEFVEFSFAKNISTEMGVFSYLIWLKEDVCPLTEICFDRMVSLGLNEQKEKELDISLLVSVKLSNCKLVNFLLEKGAKVKMNHISVAIVSSRVDVLELLKNEESVSKIDILQKACKEGYVEVVSKLLNDREIDMKQSDISKRLIQNAIEGGHSAIFKAILLAQTAFTSMVFDVSGNDLPLYHFVVSKQNAALIDVLTEMRFRPTEIDNKGRTPLLYAIQSGKKSIIDKLLQLSIEDKVHCLPDNDQNTPLYEAITTITTSSRKEQNYFHDLALRLCSFKDNIFLTNKHGQTALNLACKHRFIPVVEAILQHEDPFIKEGSSLFHSFVASDNYMGISTLLECNIDPNIHDQFHRTPFMLAVALQKTKIVRLLMYDERIERYNKQIGILPQNDLNVRLNMRSKSDDEVI